jgi:Domain of unknown function (DUF4873)
MTDEEYRGPATIRAGDQSVETEVRLSARFEPVEGRYRWSGRTAASDALLAEVRAGTRRVTVVIAGRTTPATMSDPDPWGGVRLTGVGTAPWSSAQLP